MKCPSTETQPESRLFAEVAACELIVAGKYRQTEREVKLSADASGALLELIAQARASGVKIILISGFRTIAYQESLFRKAVAKYGSEEAASRWVAPPGHSEHHTGLAIDLGDEENPSCDVQTSFEATRAFRWLQENAAQFGFELSFPRNNLRGVNYEPWHWRFVGTSEAMSIFKK